MAINPNIFIQLSESEKRVLFVILLALIVIIIIIGGIGYIIQRVMANQGKRLDDAVYYVCTYKVIKDERHFKRYAFKKNCQMFIKEAWLPLLIVVIGGLVWLIRDIVYNDFAYNPLNRFDGFGSVLWVWDFSNPIYYTKVFGLTILCEWPALLNSPHLVKEGWGAYLSVPCIAIGGIWYIITVQAFFARLFKTRSLGQQVFSKSLDNYNQLRGFDKPAAQQPAAPQPQPQVQPQNQQGPFQQPFFPGQNNGGNNGNGFPPFGGQQ